MQVQESNLDPLYEVTISNHLLQDEIESQVNNDDQDMDLPIAIRKGTRKCTKQPLSLDYLETFAPVAKMNTVRVLLSLAAKYGWELQQF